MELQQEQISVMKLLEKNFNCIFGRGGLNVPLRLLINKI